MKHNTEKWIEALTIIADEMETAGQDVLADHLDSVIGDLIFQREYPDPRVGEDLYSQVMNGIRDIRQGRQP